MTVRETLVSCKRNFASITLQFAHLYGHLYMANIYGGVEVALDNRQVRCIASERLHLLNANRSRMEHLIRGNSEAATQQQSHHPSPDVPTLQPNQETYPQETVKENGEDDSKMLPATQFNVAIPSRHSAKFASLMKHTIDIIGSNRLGEVVINNRTLKNTSFTDVMRALYVDSNFNVPGLPQVVAELKRLDVPTELFSSKRARNMYLASSRATPAPQQQGSGCRRSSDSSSAIHRYRKHKAARILRLY